ncbi:MAG: sulfatase [Fermentimonas sp.]|nr:sulfatase [Fermentimonas sp.]
MKNKIKAGLFGTALSTSITFLQAKQPVFNENSKVKTLPNIVLIHLDDMGYGDLSLTGAVGYKTPNIDRLANNGLFFTQYYSPQAVSSASRAGLLTGCYPNRIGFSGALGPEATIGISDNEMTIAELLKQKGYATAAYGKWHLGMQKQFLPTSKGFDEFYGIPYSNDMWPNHPTGSYPDLPYFKNEKIINPAVSPADQEQFTTDFTLHTINFIKENRNSPFFIYLAHPMPHVPLYVSDKFKGKSGRGLYGDVMMEIDWGVGEIIKHLEQNNLIENTLVIFTSDNGPWINYGNHAGSTGGLREGKGTTFEGGQRVTCIVMWKGVIPEGSISNSLVSAIDILPTLAEITNATLPDNKIDGISFLPILNGDLEAKPRENFLYYYRQNSLQAVRHRNWKLVFPHPGRTYENFQPGIDGKPGQVDENFNHTGGLYDLRRDPGERYDVSESHPDIVEKLTQIANEARSDLGDDLTGSKGSGRREPGRAN